MTLVSPPQSSRRHEGGVYIPPDFDPSFWPTLYTPTDAPAGNFRAINTSHISQYEIIPDTESLYTTVLAGDQTEAYCVGGRRNTFTRTYAPGAEPSTGLEGRGVGVGESTALLKELYGGPTVMKEPDTNRMYDSFRGPDLKLHGGGATDQGVILTIELPPLYGAIDDTYTDTKNLAHSIASAPVSQIGMDSKQPPWTPECVHQRVEEIHKVQPLPVYSVTTSGVSSQSPGPSQSYGSSDAHSTFSSTKLPLFKGKGKGRGKGKDVLQPGSKGGRLRRLFACFS